MRCRITPAPRTRSKSDRWVDCSELGELWALGHGNRAVLLASTRSEVSAAGQRPVQRTASPECCQVCSRFERYRQMLADISQTVSLIWHYRLSRLTCREKAVCAGAERTSVGASGVWLVTQVIMSEMASDHGWRSGGARSESDRALRDAPSVVRLAHEVLDCQAHALLGLMDRRYLAIGGIIQVGSAKMQSQPCGWYRKYDPDL